MNLSLVLIHFGDIKNTLSTLSSVELNLIPKNINFEIIIVDNSSQNNQKTFRAYKYIRTDKNLGFAGGANIGIKKAIEINSDLIIVCNNDLFFDKNSIENLVKASDKAEIICPKIYFMKGYEFHKKRYKKTETGRVLWYAGGVVDWKNILGSHIGVDQVDIGQFNTQREIEFATGACMLIKREVVEKVGLFDEKYFLYLEDLDYSVRAKRNSFKILYEPKAIVWHKNAGSSSSGSQLQDYFITRNRLRFAYKFANSRTKIAILKRVFVDSLKNKIRRKALTDFLTNNYGTGSFRMN